MKGIIRIGDTTTGGGKVFSGSEDMVFDGIGAARLGDPVLCPIPGHGRTIIAEGNPTYCDNGVPVAFDGHLCACGCALISSLSAATAR
ncbi:PAAR domain-containing protein [Pseudomonas sp. G.S.17]|uniref:PAAR domain-containing protein n=1 Tax=Pseudomonas sp. G.S.17 TaxID=3137451 RepID=UPI00311CA913